MFQMSATRSRSRVSVLLPVLSRMPSAPWSSRSDTGEDYIMMIMIDDINDVVNAHGNDDDIDRSNDYDNDDINDNNVSGRDCLTSPPPLARAWCLPTCGSSCACCAATPTVSRRC